MCVLCSVAVAFVLYEVKCKVHNQYESLFEMDPAFCRHLHSDQNITLCKGKLLQSDLDLDNI